MTFLNDPVDVCRPTMAGLIAKNSYNLEKTYVPDSAMPCSNQPQSLIKNKEKAVIIILYFAREILSHRCTAGVKLPRQRMTRVCTGLSSAQNLYI